MLLYVDKTSKYESDAISYIKYLISHRTNWNSGWNIVVISKINDKQHIKSVMR